MPDSSLLSGVGGMIIASSAVVQIRSIVSQQFPISLPRIDHTRPGISGAISRMPEIIVCFDWAVMAAAKCVFQRLSRVGQLPVLTKILVIGLPKMQRRSFHFLVSDPRVTSSCEKCRVLTGNYALAALSSVHLRVTYDCFWTSINTAG